MGNTKLTPKMKDDIFNCLVSKNMTVDNMCKDCGISKQTFYNWYNNDDNDFLDYSAGVREVKAHKHIHEADEIIKVMLDISEDGADREEIERMKFKLNKYSRAYDMKLRLAGKYNRKVYGEKVDTDVTSGGKEIKQVAIVPNRQEAEKWGKK